MAEDLEDIAAKEQGETSDVLLSHHHKQYIIYMTEQKQYRVKSKTTKERKKEE